MNGAYALLNLLPGMHASILSIVAAIITSWFFYAFPKLVEAKSNLELLLSNSSNLFTPEICSKTELDIRDSDGLISFEKIHQQLNHQNFIPKNSGANDKVLLENTIHYLLIMASITGDNTFQKWCNPKLREKDYNLFDNINGRNIAILKDYINMTIASYEFRGDQMKHLFNTAYEIQLKETINPHEIGYNNFMARHKKNIEQFQKDGDMDGLQDYIKKAEPFKQSYISDMEKHEQEIMKNPSLSQIYDSIASRLYAIRDILIPQLENSLAQVRYSENLLKQGGLIKNVVRIIFFNVVLGIVAPLFFISIESNMIDWNSTPVTWFTFTLALITIIPYLTICAKAIKAIR
ncbi:TPA: hypothetical protein L9R33_004597 [Klebsiella pneumoniae]|nr:hypothetical protein [Klebsiella pneumoniae]